jgi:phosphoribosylformylglycinamidine synthase
VATVDDAFLLDVLTGADAAGVQIEPIGRTAGQRLIFELADGDFCVTLAELRAAHEGFFPKLMGADAALA